MISQKEIPEKGSGRKIFLVVSVFYVIAISLRYLTNKTQILSGIDNTFIKVILQAIGPTIGALVAFRLFRIKPVMTLKGDFKNFFVPLAIYWLLPVILIETTAYFSTSTSPRIAVITILVYGLFEEIGWRGFLQQALVSLPKFTRITLVTVLWFAWHLNFEMSMSNLTFLLILLAGSWALGFIADKTNSLLAVSAIHSLNNFFADSNVYKIGVLSFLLIIWVLSIVYRHKLGNNKVHSYLPVTLV